MKKNSILLLLGIWLFIPKNISAPITSSPTEESISIDNVSLTSDQKIVMEEINKYRTEHGLKRVEPEISVCEVAKERAKEISISWTQPNQPQVHNAFLTRKFPYKGYWTENLARAIPPEEIVKAWENSPTHKENLLADTPYVCVENNGVFWAMTGFKPE